jgi:hypothetical protein
MNGWDAQVAPLR